MYQYKRQIMSHLLYFKKNSYFGRQNLLGVKANAHFVNY